MSNHYRNTATRDRHRAQIRRGRPPCHICGQPINYDLPYLHPLEFVVDHVIPLALGGPDTLGNKAAAHRTCNRTKGDRLAVELKRVEPIVTSRSW
jgi:5-methylcytosine-specific restriction endonuclease McrA